MDKINESVVTNNKQCKKIHREDPIRRNLIGKASVADIEFSSAADKKRHRAAKGYITSAFAAEKLGAKPMFAQIVLRRNVRNEKACVPFLAYVVETATGIKYLPVRRGAKSAVVDTVKKGDIASISNGRTKIKKITA